MVSLIATGTAAGFTVAPALGTTATYVVVATGLSVTLQLGYRIVHKAKAEPLAWGTSILGVLAGFLVQACDKLWEGPAVLWMGFSAVVGLLIIVGGVLYGQKGRISKVLGGVVSLIAPASLVAALGFANPAKLYLQLGGSLYLWLILGSLVLCSIILAMLAHEEAAKASDGAAS